MIFLVIPSAPKPLRDLIAAVGDGVATAYKSYSRRRLESRVWEPRALLRHIGSSAALGARVRIRGTLSSALPLDPSQQAVTPDNLRALVAGSSLDGEQSLYTLWDPEAKHTASTEAVTLGINTRNLPGGVPLTAPLAAVLEGTLVQPPASWSALLDDPPQLFLADVIPVEFETLAHSFMSPIWALGNPSQPENLAGLEDTLLRVRDLAIRSGDPTATKKSELSLSLYREEHLLLGVVEHTKHVAMEYTILNRACRTVATWIFSRLAPGFMENIDRFRENGGRPSNEEIETLRRRFEVQVPDIANRFPELSPEEAWRITPTQTRQMESPGGVDSFSNVMIIHSRGYGEWWAGKVLDLTQTRGPPHGWYDIQEASRLLMRTMRDPLYDITIAHPDSELAETAKRAWSQLWSASSPITDILFQSDQQLKPLPQQLLIGDILDEPLAGIEPVCVPSRFRQRVADLARRFQSHRSTPTDEDIWRFVAQARDERYVEGLLELLDEVDFIDPPTLDSLLAGAWNQLCESTGAHPTLLPLGELGGSTAIALYSLTHHLENIRECELSEWLQIKYSDSSGAFVDDCALSGTQAVEILEQALNRLPSEEARRLRDRTLHFAFATASNEAVSNIRQGASRLGLRIGQIVRGRSEDMGKWFDDAEPNREAFKRFCLRAGADLMAPRAARNKWSSEKTNERLLGYGDCQKRLVFHYNTPKSTIPLLWEAGTAMGRPWKPLFQIVENY